MTDEEKAEELTAKQFDLDTDKVRYFCNLYKNDYHEVHTFYNGILVGYEQGQKEKWHDLRKNPDDLPNSNTAVLVCFQFEEWTTTYIAYYRPAVKKWQIYNLLEAQREPIVDDYIDSEEVIAWCECPKFEE